MQVRNFYENNIEKIDRLMKYLFSKDISYTCHWIYPKNKKIEDAGKENIAILQIRWFE